jgi:putative transposase
VDQGYSGYDLKQKCGNKGIELEVVKRKEEGFKLLPKRWVVERTLGWLSRYRRLSKDYEGLIETSQNWIYVSMIRLMVNRIDLK